MEINIYVLIIGCVVALLLPWVIIAFTNRKIYSWLLFIIYLIILCIGVFSEIEITKQSIIFNFEININYCFNVDKFLLWGFGLSNILINITMFIPFGMFIYYITKQRFWLTILIGFLSSLAIEFLQLALPIIRNAELFDIIANTISCAIGAIYCLVIIKVINKIKTLKK